MIEMEMTDDDLFDVAQAVTSAFDRGIEFMMRLVLDPRKDVRYLRPPDCWICTSVTTSVFWQATCRRRRTVFPTASLPQNTAFYWVLDQHAVHGQLAPLVHKCDILGAVQRGVAASYDKSFVRLQPSHL